VRHKARKRWVELVGERERQGEVKGGSGGARYGGLSLKGLVVGGGGGEVNWEP